MSLLANINAFFGGELVRILSSCAVIVAAIFFNHLNVRYQTAPSRAQTRGSQARQQLVLIKNVIILTAVCLIIMIWATKIVGIALSLSAFAMALVLSTKELIMCITGYIMFALSRPFNVGDHIQLSGVQGMVVDVDLMNLTLSETNGSHQITGKRIVLPNSVLLSAIITNNSSLNAYVVSTLRIAVPYATPRAELTEIAIEVASEICEPWAQDSLRHFQQLGSIAMLETPSNKVEVFWHPFDTKQHWVEIRFMVPVSQQEKVAQDIQNGLWARFGEQLIAANQ